MSILYEAEVGDEAWRPRTAREVAERCIVLCCVAAAGQFTRGFFNNWLKREGLWSVVSPREVSFLTSLAPDRQQTIDATWRSESLQLLLWALGKIESLPSFNQLAGVDAMLEVMPEPDSPVMDFLDESTLRDAFERDAMYESVYNAHSRLRSAMLRGQAPPLDVNRGVVYERHYALNWLIGYENQTWDMVNTDT